MLYFVIKTDFSHKMKVFFAVTCSNDGNSLHEKHMCTLSVTGIHIIVGNKRNEVH